MTEQGYDHEQAKARARALLGECGLTPAMVRAYFEQRQAEQEAEQEQRDAIERDCRARQQADDARQRWQEREAARMAARPRSKPGVGREFWT